MAMAPKVDIQSLDNNMDHTVVDVGTGTSTQLEVSGEVFRKTVVLQLLSSNQAVNIGASKVTTSGDNRGFRLNNQYDSITFDVGKTNNDLYAISAGTGSADIMVMELR